MRSSSNRFNVFLPPGFRAEGGYYDSKYVEIGLNLCWKIVLIGRRTFPPVAPPL